MSALLILPAMLLDLGSYLATPYQYAESNPLATLGIPAIVVLKVAATVALVLLVGRVHRYRGIALALAVGLPLVGAASNLRVG